MGLFQSKQEKQLIALQNFLFSRQSHRLEMTPKQIINAASSYVNARNKIIQAADKQLDAADHPKKFFDVLEKVKGAIKDNERLEQAAPGTTNMRVGEGARKLDAGLPKDIDAMIDRCWEKTQLEAAKESREDSKRKKYDTFFETMKIYESKMYPQNIEHLSRLWDSIYKE